MPPLSAESGFSRNQIPGFYGRFLSNLLQNSIESMAEIRKICRKNLWLKSVDSAVGFRGIYIKFWRILYHFICHQLPRKHQNAVWILRWIIFYKIQWISVANLETDVTWSMELDERVWPKIRHLAPLEGCICAFEECVYWGQKVP